MIGLNIARVVLALLSCGFCLLGLVYRILLPGGLVFLCSSRPLIYFIINHHKHY